MSAKTTPWALPEILRAWKDRASARTGLALEVEYDEAAGRLRIHDCGGLDPVRDVIEAYRGDYEQGPRWDVKHLDDDWLWQYVGDETGYARLWPNVLDAVASCFDDLIDKYARLRQAYAKEAGA